MKTKPTFRGPGLFLALLPVAALVVGCPEDKPQKSEAEIKAEVEAKLAKADEQDGKVDKIVSNCANCGLRMSGSAEQKLDTHGYTMHFCREGCKKKFEKDPDKAILALRIPEK